MKKCVAPKRQDEKNIKSKVAAKKINSYNSRNNFNFEESNTVLGIQLII